MSREIWTYDRETWRTRLEKCLVQSNNHNQRDLFRELNSHLAHSPLLKSEVKDHREAAVLVLIIDKPDEPTILFTRRTLEMPSHPGQISFPGGGKKPGDTDLTGTALREAQEEVDLDIASVIHVGELAMHVGGMGFAVKPVVAIAPYDAKFKPCPREVAEIFEVPLSFLLNPSNHLVETRKEYQTHYRSFAIPYKEYHIWGLTASILRSLCEVLRGEDVPVLELESHGTE